jgi:hypothetical protein
MTADTFDNASMATPTIAPFTRYSVYETVLIAAIAGTLSIVTVS